MECICRITVALKWSCSCALEEAAAQGFSTFAEGLEAQGSWKATATLRVLGHRARIHRRRLYWKKEGWEIAHPWLLPLIATRNEEFGSTNVLPPSEKHQGDGPVPLAWPRQQHRKLSACKSCNRSLICYMLPASWPPLFVIPTVGQPSALSWEKHPERAFCALGEGKGREASKGTLSSGLAVLGSASGRAKTLLLWTECQLSDLYRTIVGTQLHTFPCFSEASVEVKSLTPVGLAFPLKIPKRKRKSSRHHWMHFIYFQLAFRDGCCLKS